MKGAVEIIFGAESCGGNLGIAGARLVRSDQVPFPISLLY